MSNIYFRGWGQYTKEEFNKLPYLEKHGKILFVRDLDQSGNTRSSQIYFGSRLYAEINDSGATSEIINNIIASLGEMVDSQGIFNGFSIDHEILSSATDTTSALTLLETAIVSINNKTNEIDGRLKNVEDIVLYVTGNDTNIS